jgi:hypothetical protein
MKKLTNSTISTGNSTAFIIIPTIHLRVYGGDENQISLLLGESSQYITTTVRVT